MVGDGVRCAGGGTILLAQRTPPPPAPGPGDGRRGGMAVIRLAQRTPADRQGVCGGGAPFFLPPAGPAGGLWGGGQLG